MTTEQKIVAICKLDPPFLTVDDVLRCHAEHGRLDYWMVKRAMGPNWPKHWDELGPGDGIFHPDEPADR